MEFKGIVYDKIPQALYVHVPFCGHICSYCDFTRVKYQEKLVEQWLCKIEEELQQIPTCCMRTIYIGGGTPTCLNKTELERLLKLLDGFQGVEEYTIEVNPETMSFEKACLLHQYGINRISMGVQSFQTHLLKLMGRRHRDKDVLQCLQWFHEVGIHNISLDFIYGLPQQTMKDWKKDLEIACMLDIQHISLYSLTIEEHSRFARMQIEAMDADLEFEMYEYAIQYVASCGFQQYEVSNFAKGGCVSKHNLVYWHYEDFYGIGLGASGKLGSTRYTQTSNFLAYFRKEDTMEVYQLHEVDERFEAIMMGLRVFEGICLDTYNKRYLCDLCKVYQKAIEKNVSKEYLKIENGFLKVTRAGMYVLHDVLLDFMEEK